jgi:phosphatidate cytidylyltransferase
VTATPPKKSDLGVRTLSAIVMVAVAGTALWLGGWVWTAFVALVALGVLWEWKSLVFAISPLMVGRLTWIAVGFIYVGGAAFALNEERSFGLSWALTIILLVIAIDVGAYFSGRTFGGPKIAPRISPSKTWAGLLGGSLAASVVLAFSDGCIVEDPVSAFEHWQLCVQGSLNRLMSAPLAFSSVTIFGGMLAAILAQSGDFFESWLKRKAGVKDSGKLIPGHGGLFDRVDGLLALAFALFLIRLS